MGATLTQRYGTLDGKAYPTALVGWAWEQDPYDYHYTYYTYNSRFTIVTDAAGGASLTVGSIGWKEQRNNRNHILTVRRQTARRSPRARAPSRSR